ncbi:ABC transporter permease [Arachnia propionica]|uniref:ABC transporter permease n=1 Tax=Arachnia propionica TaxID=1750 RepID=UPI0030CC1E1B
MSSVQALGRGPVAGWLGDVHAVLVRNLLQLRRSPEIIAFSLTQPIMFVLLFTQVYGGAVHVQGSDYTQFLMAGVFGQTIVFGSMISGMYMAEDLKEGIIDRFRTLPMAPSAILMARTLADLAVAACSVIVMLIAGSIVGWRFHAGLGNFLLGVLLLLVTAWCFSWVMVLLGVTVPNPQSLQSISTVVVLPVSFVSNAFVPSETLPDWLRMIAEWNPLSSLVQAVRTLFGNLGTAPIPDVWPLQNSVAAIVIAWVVLLAIFPALTAVVFRRRVAR